jgi:hypothetical protein
MRSNKRLWITARSDCQHDPVRRALAERRSGTFKGVLLIGASALSLPSSAIAGGVPTLDEVIVTASPTDLAGTADTASEGTVLKQQIDERPVYRPGELFETVPGLIVTQHSGEGKANQYFLRGFNLDHGTDIAISVDDMPVNIRSNAHGQGYSDLNFMIPELVRNLQYRKGPYFAEEGDFATAGAVHVNYVNELPHDLASVSAGTLGDYRAFSAASRPVGAGNLLLAAEYSHLDGPWIIPDNFNKGNLVLRYSQGTPENGFSITGMFMDDAFHATNQIAQRALTEGLISRFGAIDPTDGGSSERYSLSGKFAHTTEAGQFKVNVYFIGYTLQLFNDFDYSLVFPPPINDQFEQQDRRKIYGANVSYASSSKVFGLDTENTAGFQFRADDAHLGLARTTEQAVRFVVRDDHVIEASGGFYVENRTRWLDKVRTVAGLREDVFYGSDTSSLAANSGVTSKGEFSPKASLILGPWAKTEFYASGGQGFHSNDVRGAVTTVDAFQTLINQQAGNNILVRQGKTPFLTKATGYEVGVRSAIVPHVQAEVALFDLDLASEATFNGDQAETSAGRPSRRQGIEVSTFYAPLPWLIVDADFAFSRARFTDADPGTADTIPGRPGNYIPGSAKIIASAGVTVANLEQWEGGLRYRYFGPRPLLEDGSVRSGPTVLVDARIGYKLTDQLRAQLDIFNLFNSRAHQIDYYYASQLANESAPVNDIHFHPVEPLSFRLTLAATF